MSDMAGPWDVYELLLDQLAGPADDHALVEDILIGNVWTLCYTGNGALGMAMSPAAGVRTLPWSGTLAGRNANELAPWVRSWNMYEAAVGMAVINSRINARVDTDLIDSAVSLQPLGQANLAVFEHFLSRLRKNKVVVIGRYPGLERYIVGLDITVLERRPGVGDIPDPACEYLLPEADWVFLTASSLCNKTFPRLAELSRNATLVLMGPTTPWLRELSEFGVDYLAGVTVSNESRLYQTVAEGGGMRIFNADVSYHVAAIGAQQADDIAADIAIEGEAS